MEDSDKVSYPSSFQYLQISSSKCSFQEDIEKETLQQQFVLVKNITTTSHAQEYGDLTIGNLVVGEFQGEQAAPPKTLPKVPFKRGAPSWEVPLDILYKRLAAATSDSQKQSIRSEIDSLIEVCLGH